MSPAPGMWQRRQERDQAMPPGEKMVATARRRRRKVKREQVVEELRKSEGNDSKGEDIDDF